MPLNTQNTRVTFKYSTISGETPTIAPSLDHTDGTWSPTDLYVGEFFLNAVDDNMWIRTLNGIVPITSGTSSISISTYVNKTGDTMTGDLNLPSLSASTSVTSPTFYGTTFSGGTYYGDGSNLTGIVANWNGGTVTGDTTFTGQVDLCGAGVTIDSIEVCSGSTFQIIGNTEVNGTLTTTNDLTVGGVIYGDGSGITGIPSLSAITLDEVLIQGDTSVNGDINLINGNITLTNGIFYGDGSGLTNIPTTASTPSLDQVLAVGNDAGSNWIEFSKPYGIRGNYYGLGNSDYIQFNDGSVRISSSDFTYGSYIETSPDRIVMYSDNEFLVTGGGLYEGIKYTSDYSSNFVNRSLVDKEYVDNSITGYTGNTLSQVLSNGNTTGTNHIVLSDGNNSTIQTPNGLNRIAMFDGGIVDGGIGLICEEGNFYNTLYVEDNSITAQCIHQVTGDVSAWSLTDVGGFGVSHSAGGNFSFFNLQDNEARLGGPSNFVLVYNNDYSANYTNRSLVDKEYVDNSITGYTGNTLSQVLTNGNETGNNDIIFDTQGKGIKSSYVNGSAQTIEYTINQTTPFGTFKLASQNLTTGLGGSVEFLYDELQLQSDTNVVITSDFDISLNGVTVTENQLYTNTKFDYAVVSNAHTFDCNNGMIQYLDLQNSTADVTLTITNQQDTTYTFIIVQASGLHDVIFPSGYWLNDTAPFDFTTLADNERAMVTMTYLGTDWYFAAKKLTFA